MSAAPNRAAARPAGWPRLAALLGLLACCGALLRVSAADPAAPTSPAVLGLAVAAAAGFLVLGLWLAGGVVGAPAGARPARVGRSAAVGLSRDPRPAVPWIVVIAWVLVARAALTGSVAGAIGAGLALAPSTVETVVDCVAILAVLVLLAGLYRASAALIQEGAHFALDALVPTVEAAVPPADSLAGHAPDDGSLGGGDPTATPRARGGDATASGATIPARDEATIPERDAAATRAADSADATVAADAATLVAPGGDPTVRADASDLTVPAHPGDATIAADAPDATASADRTLVADPDATHPAGPAGPRGGDA